MLMGDENGGERVRIAAVGVEPLEGLFAGQAGID
jgi:hypothetical protein